MNFMGLKYMAVTAIYAAATIIYMDRMGTTKIRTDEE